MIKQMEFANEYISTPGDEYIKERHERIIRNKIDMRIIFAVFFLFSLTIYISIGYFYPELWPSLWVILFSAPIAKSIYKAVRTGASSSFNFTLVAIAFFCSFGAAYDLWNPLWTILLTIPVYYVIAYFVDKRVYTIKKV